MEDRMKGKAKEVIGAVTGNDSLTAEGQLEQAEAQKRKDASRAQAVRMPPIRALMGGMAGSAIRMGPPYPCLAGYAIPQPPATKGRR